VSVFFSPFFFFFELFKSLILLFLFVDE